MDSARPKGGSNGQPGERRDAELQARVRVAGWLLTGCLAAFAVAELVARPGEKPVVSAVHCIALGFLLLLLIGSYRVRSRRGLTINGLLGLTAAAATASAVSVVTGDANTASFVFVALAMGSAALLPWGYLPQLVLGAILLPLYLVTIVLSEGHFSPLRLREFLGVLVVVGASVYIAYQLERSRAEARIEAGRRLERERQIETQRRFLRQVIDTDPHLVFAKDRDGHFTLVNQAVAEVYGTTVEDLIGRTDADFNPHAEEVAFFRAIDLRVFETAQEQQIEEEKITDAQGRERWLRTIKRPLLAEDGSVAQVLGVATDITEQRKFQRQLAEEAYVAAALSAAAEEIIASLSKPDLAKRLCAAATNALGGKWAQLWLIDPQRNDAHPVGNYNFSDEVWDTLRIVRVPLTMVSSLAQRIQQKELIQLDHRAAQTMVPQFLLTLAAGFSGALVIPLRRGKQVSGALIVGLLEGDFPLHPSQERIARGLSQLASLALENARVMEELEQASRLKSEFMATMSHELRTPLNVIIGYTALLHEEVLGRINAEQAEALARLHANALQLLDMVNGILDLTRLESGRLPLDVRRISLTEVVASAVREVRQQYREKAVDLWCLLPPQGPEIETDPSKLKVVVKNLVSNAVKFTASGWVRVSAARSDDSVQIIVEDTGVGIPAEEQPMIFEPFRQGRAAGGQSQSGVGLGLYIVRRMVEAMGGQIMVDSELGRGSTFVVQLPLRRFSLQREQLPA